MAQPARTTHRHNPDHHRRSGRRRRDIRRRAARDRAASRGDGRPAFRGREPTRRRRRDRRTLGVQDAAPDGRTLLLASYATFVVNPTLMKHLPLRSDRRLPADHDAVLVPDHACGARPPCRRKRLRSWLHSPRRKPGGLSYGSQGVGTTGHLLGELVAKSSGAPMVHVPTRAPRRRVIDLVAGRVDLMFVGVLPTKPHLASGTLRRARRHLRRAWRKCLTLRRWPRPDIRTSTPSSSGSASRRRPRRRAPMVSSLHQRFAKAVMIARRPAGQARRARRHC